MPIRREQQLAIDEAPITRRFGLMAEPLRFETNDPALLAAAQASFGRFPVPPPDGREPLVVRLIRGDEAMGNAPPAAEALRYRTSGHLLLVTHGGADVATVDVSRGIALGFVTPATADDEAFVRYAFVETMALAMLAPSRGYLTLHAAGIVRDGTGLALLGPAGSGKSTLAIAAARRGHGIFAEDAVFVRAAPPHLELWGMPWTQRLLPDAAAQFPEVAGLPARRQLNGEHKLEIDLEALFPGSAIPCAPAAGLVTIERGTGGPTRVERLDAPEAAEALVVLWAFEGGWTAGHDAAAARLAELPIHRLHNNGTPDEAVDALERLLAGLGR
jgi:hypothetical protein